MLLSFALSDPTLLKSNSIAKLPFNNALSPIGFTAAFWNVSPPLIENLESLSKFTLPLVSALKNTCFIVGKSSLAAICALSKVTDQSVILI